MSERLRGSTSVSLEFRLANTDGSPATGLDVTTLKLQHHRPRENPGAATALTPLGSDTAAWTAHGSAEVDAVNSPGIYRVDCPNAAFAAGNDEVVITITGDDILPVSRLIDLVSINMRATTVPVDNNQLAQDFWDAAPEGVPVAEIATAVRTELAAELDRIDDDISSRAPSSTALSNAVWTNAKAAVLYAGINNDIVNAVWNYTVETGVSARQALAIIGSANSGKAAGLETTSVVYYAMGTSGTNTPRIQATVDQHGNRTAITLSPPS